MEIAMKNKLKYFLFLLPALAAVLIYFILPHFPTVTENVFSRGVFYIFSWPLGWVVSLIPFSLTEAALFIGGLIWLVYGVFFWIGFAKKSKPERREILKKTVRRYGWVLSCALLLYMIMHGANYYRYPVEKLMNLDVSTGTPEELRDICVNLAQKASAEREALSENDKGEMILSQTMSKTLERADEGYKKIQEQYPFLRGGVWRTKPVILSHYWSYTGITGMYFPLWGEANVNTDGPHCDIPFTAAHELAHTRGFAREDECNFFAYVSGIHSTDAEYRYSAYLSAFLYCAGDLSPYEELHKEVWSHISDAIRRDLTGRNEYWKQFETPVGKVVGDASEKVNDAFIKGQGVEDGVLSYGRVSQLIIGYERNWRVTTDQ